MADEEAKERQREGMREAVDRKTEQARAQSEQQGRDAAFEAEQQSRETPDRQQDDLDVRAKNSGHGKKTADKWNQ